MLFCIKESNKTRKTKESSLALHQRAILRHDALATPQNRVRECKSRNVDESPEMCKGEECMASAGTSLRHTGSLAADREGKPRRYLLCVRVPACVTLCCPVSKTAAAAPWR